MTIALTIIAIIMFLQLVVRIYEYKLWIKIINKQIEWDISWLLQKQNKILAEISNQNLDITDNLRLIRKNTFTYNK